MVDQETVYTIQRTETKKKRIVFRECNVIFHNAANRYALSPSETVI